MYRKHHYFMSLWAFGIGIAMGGMVLFFGDRGAVGTWIAAAGMALPWLMGAAVQWVMAKENAPVEVIHMVRLPKPVN